MNDLDTRLRHMAREEETPVPKDFDENLTRALAQLPARKRRRVPRAVLLAACLVLMLTGAVLAAESGVFARFGTPGDLNTEGLFYDGTEYGGTWTYSTDRRLPLADIPQASQEAARTSTEDLQFPDMAAADAFLGGSVLPRSAQQEATALHRGCLSWMRKATASAAPISRPPRCAAQVTSMPAGSSADPLPVVASKTSLPR